MCSSQIIKVVPVPLKAYASSPEAEKSKVELSKSLPEAPFSSGQSLQDLSGGMAQTSGNSMNDLHAPLMGEALSSFSCAQQGMGLTRPSLLDSGRDALLQRSRASQGKMRQMGPCGKYVERSLGLVKQWCQVKIQWELLLFQLKVRDTSAGMGPLGRHHRGGGGGTSEALAAPATSRGPNGRGCIAFIIPSVDSAQA